MAGMYLHHTKNYQSSLLTLVTHENIFWWIERRAYEENKINLMARETPEQIKKVHRLMLITAGCSDTVCVMQSTSTLLNYCMMICLRLTT